jgi:hypothetical protein
MKNLLAVAVVAAGVTASMAHAQSTATSAQTSNSSSNASNTGTNASTNTSGASANQSATSASNNQGNNQWNGSASLSSGGAGGSAGATGGNVSATINPTTTIQFNSPPTSRVESASVQDTTSRVEQSGTTEQILSGTRTERIEYSGTTTVRNVPSMNAPPLTSSNDTCMGSWSAGVAVAGFGASGGNTYTDEHCKRIKMSRELWNKGMKAASLALDCMDRDAREALELTGFVCPQTTRAQQRAGMLAPVSVSSAAVVTPVVASAAATATASTTAAPVVLAGTAGAPDASVTVRVLDRPRRPGYEHVNPDDPFINR